MQTYTACKDLYRHAQLFSGTEGLLFGQHFHLLHDFARAVSEGSDGTAHVLRLVSSRLDLTSTKISRANLML